MARKMLLFWLLQFLPLLVSANAGFNSSSENSIDFDMANVEELVSTLHNVKNPEINAFDDANGDREILQPFGNLKSDWSRLHLLRENLPDDSVIKNKFHHLIRLLKIAHDEATRFLLLSRSTKLQDAFKNQTTKSFAKEDKSAVAEHEEFSSSMSQEVREKLKTISTTPTSVLPESVHDSSTKSRASDVTMSFPKSDDDGVDAVVKKTKTKVFDEHGKEKETNVLANTTNSDSTIKFSTTTPTLISTLEYREPSTADSILIPVTTVSGEDIIFSTPIHEESRPSTVTLLPTSISKDLTSTRKTAEQILGMKSSAPFEKYITTTERILNEEFKKSSTSEEYTSVDSISSSAATEIQSLNSTSRENTLTTTEVTNIEYSSEPPITGKSVDQPSITEEYPSAATVSSTISTKNPSIVSIVKSDTFLTSTEKNENTSRVQSSTDSLLPNNFTAGFTEEEKTLFNKTQTQSTLIVKSYSSTVRPSTEFVEHTSGSTKLFSTKSTSTVDPPIRENEENKSKSSNNQAENVLIEKTTRNDSTERAVNVTPKVEEDREIKLTQGYQTEVSISDKSFPKVWSTTDSIKKISSVSPTIEKSDDKTLTNQNNRMENSTSEKFNLSATGDSMENTLSVSPTIKQDDKNEQTSLENKTKNPSYATSTSKIWSTIDSIKITPTIKQDDKNEQTSLENKTKNPGYATSSSKIWSTTDSIKITSSVTPKIDKNEGNELKSQNYETEISGSEITNTYPQEITNPIESVSSVTPTFQNNEKTNVTSKNNQTELRMVEKTTANDWRSTDSTDSASTIPTTEVIQEINSPKQNNETKVSVGDKSIPSDKDVFVSPSSTLVSTTTEIYKNTTESVAKTKVMDTHKKSAQNSVSMELSTEGQEAESSTRNYAGDQSTVTTTKNEVNISRYSEPKNETVIPEAEFTTKKNANNAEENLEHTSEESEDVATVTENSEKISHSENGLAKPYFVKNPLNIGSSRSNNIFRDYKHGSNDSGAEKNLESPQIVLYESGAGARTGSVWRPQLVRQPPAGNNIWKYDNFPGNVGPYGYRQPPPQQADTKADVRKDEKNPTKFPARGNRMNSLSSRKRGSANSDIEKQFRWFYRRGQADPAQKFRDKENDNAKIKIRCKKAQRH